MDRLLDIVARLPEGCAVIYRHFGEPLEAEALRDLTQKQNRQLLIGNDPELAEKIGADGVHFSRDETLRGPIKWRAKHPEWIITMAGLKSGAYRAAGVSRRAFYLQYFRQPQSQRQHAHWNR
jgi:hypothetical protein